MKLIFLFSFTLLAANATAQAVSTYKYLEAGATVGFTNYSGDVAEKTMVLKETRLGFGLFARQHFSRQLALKVQGSIGFIGGTDANAITLDLKGRSLQFKSRLLEASLTGEWNFMNIKPENRNDIQQLKVIPYLFLGVGGVLIHSEVSYFGPPQEFEKRVKYALPEPGLKNKALVLPFGLGARLQVTKRIAVGLETGIRPVFSDYLDGVKLNGIANRDWYYTANASIAYDLGR